MDPDPECNCPECFKTASCVHCILASMTCNAAIRVPATCLGVTIQGRHRRGRQSARGSNVGDVPDARAHVRIELGNLGEGVSTAKGESMYVIDKF